MSTTILLVDDDKRMFNAINRLVRPLDAVVFSTASEARALDICKDYRPQIIIADLNRKDIDVNAFLQATSKISPCIRKIVLTSFAELDATVDAINKGKINRYFTKPWDANELREAISEELTEFEHQQEQYLSATVLGQKNEEMEEKVDFTTRLLNGTTELLAASQHRASIKIMSTLLEQRMAGALGHAKRVARIAFDIANQLELSPNEADQITLAAELHQIGMLGLPDNLLNKRFEDMTKAEQRRYAKYPELGAQVLNTDTASGTTGDSAVANIVRHHQENNDGSGYPAQLVAGYIPIGARVIRVAVDFERLSQAVGGTLALFEMTKDKREKYDPDVLGALIKLKKTVIATKPNLQVTARAKKKHDRETLMNLENILIVEDSEPTAIAYASFLDEHHTDIAEDLATARNFIGEATPGLMLLDVQLPDGNGLEFVTELRDQGYTFPIVVITSESSVQIAVEAIQKGANDFLEKPFSCNRLLTTVANVLDKARLNTLVAAYEKSESDRDQFAGFIGKSLAMQTIYNSVEAAAPSKASVFITGESGTGKEVLAEAIHQTSPRRDKPFVAINCGAIPRELIESEVFGHVKGAFTGANTERKGAAVLADGGTLFLDEICEMDIDLQVKLLRFLQTETFRPVGSDKEINVDIRVVCATNRNPLHEVKEGNFREDLFYRLHVIMHAAPCT